MSNEEQLVIDFNKKPEPSITYNALGEPLPWEKEQSEKEQVNKM